MIKQKEQENLLFYNNSLQFAIIIRSFILLKQGVDHGCHTEKGCDEGNYAKHKPLCSNGHVVTPYAE
jgi:hypothetical protein